MRIMYYSNIGIPESVLNGFPPESWGMESLPDIQFSRMNGDQLRDMMRVESRASAVYRSRHTHVENQVWFYCVNSKQGSHERPFINHVSLALCDYTLQSIPEVDAVEFLIFS